MTPLCTTATRLSLPTWGWALTSVAGPWVAQHFALYSSRPGRNGSIYTEEAGYALTF